MGVSVRPVIAGVLVTAAVGGAALAITGGGGGGGGISRNQTVTTRAQLVTALGNLAGTNGDTVCVTASMTGAEIDLTTKFTEQVRVIAQPADQPVDMVTLKFGKSAKITIESFDFTGEHFMDMGNSDDIHIIRNYCHDQQAGCVNGNGATDIDGTWIMGNRLERIEYTGTQDEGYGVVGRNFDNLRVEYNYCDGGSDGTANLMGDCFQIDNAEDYIELL
jgi:hypothetical protein